MQTTASSLSISARQPPWVRWSIGYALPLAGFILILGQPVLQPDQPWPSDRPWSNLLFRAIFLTVFAWVHFRFAYPPSTLRTWGQRFCVMAMLISPFAFFRAFLADL